MKWDIEFLPEADDEFSKLDGAVKPIVTKALIKVATNPGPDGYGKPLQNQDQSKLAGLLKIKLKRTGLRVVYKLIQDVHEMKIIIISARADDAVYKDAAKRREKYGL